MNIYYPLDKAIRDKNELISIDSRYIKHFLNNLNEIKKIMDGIDSVNKEEILDKVLIVRRLETTLKDNSEMI